MKISYRWLKRYLEVNLSPERVAEILTDTGLEVEGVAEVESIKGGLRGVVIGKVLTCEQHPNADRLKVTTVDVGANEPLQIVCGAPNVAAGQTVPVALVGTTLYPNGEELKLKKGKIRGEESMGMICAEDELGLGQSHDGILVLDDSWQAGTPCAEVFNMESDFVFEIGLTPNRTDAMGHIGVARDLRAALITAGEEAPLLTVPAPSFNASTTNPITLTVEDEGCPAYYGAYLTDITVKESPEWLKNSLVAIGLTPKNNVVDITNYVMHTYGHPLHAFDADAINDERALAIAAKVDWQDDPDTAFPRYYSGKLIARTKDGRTIEHREAVNRGSDANPLSSDDIAEKFWANATRAVSKSKAQRVYDEVMNLEMAEELWPLARALSLAG